MVNKMEERRKWKNVNTETGKEKYRQLNNQLRRETEKAKENWWKEECNELEEMARTGKTEKMYNKVSRLTWTKEKTTKSSNIKDSKGTLLTEPDEIRKRWKEYIEVLYDKDRKPEKDNMKLEESIDVSEDDKGPELLENEILEAIKELNTNKAEGVDEMPAEFIKALRSAFTTIVINEGIDFDMQRHV